MNYPPAESSEVLHDAVGAVLGMAGDKNVRSLHGVHLWQAGNDGFTVRFELIQESTATSDSRMRKHSDVIADSCSRNSFCHQ